MAFTHTPVLLEESLRLLEPLRGGVYVDCTLGLGGHAEALLERFPETQLIGIDRDSEALEMARSRLARFGTRVRFAHGDYRRIDQLLADRGEVVVAGILADLGVSSMQLDSASRGFSFRFSGPLDMRMDPSDVLTAGVIVNEYPPAEMERIFRDYGEERKSRRIAKAIAEAREETPLETTDQLREVIHREVGPRSGRVRGRAGIDSATRTFQALRIAVNEELSGLETFMDRALRMLDSEGRLVVISYHSLEDRIVKQKLRAGARGEIDPITGRAHSETRLIELLTKKPVQPGEAEVESNPRSRSARLRAARRIRT